MKDVQKLLRLLLEMPTCQNHCFHREEDVFLKSTLQNFLPAFAKGPRALMVCGQRGSLCSKKTPEAC